MADEIPDVNFRIKLFMTPQDIPRSRFVVLTLMETLAQISQSLLRSNPRIPDLYAMGAAGKVRYKREPGRREWWQDILTTIQIGWGDCEDLATWRIAELRQKYGVAARPYIKWNDSFPDGRFHAVVELPDGRIEDPSAALGMNGAPIRAQPIFVSRE